jgi:hypothetical protein
MNYAFHRNQGRNRGNRYHRKKAELLLRKDCRTHYLPEEKWKERKIIQLKQF